MYKSASPPELQQEAFLTGFFKVWIKRNGDVDTCADLLQKVIGVPEPGVVSPTGRTMKRHSLCMDALANGCLQKAMSDDDVDALFRNLFDNGLLADSVLFKWCTDKRGALSPELQHLAGIVQRVAEDDDDE